MQYSTIICSLKLTTSIFLNQANPNFQMKYGYDADPPLGANYALCSNQIAQRFNCLAVTFEMPFKDCINHRGIEVPWLGNEAERLGASILNAISETLPFLREADLSS